MEELKDLFFRLIEIDAPSGFEEPMMKEFINQLQPYVDEIGSDTRGNCWGFKNGTNADAPTVALMSHLDQVGMIIS